MNISYEIQKNLSENLSDLILRLPKFTKVFCAILFDIFCCVISLWISYYLRLGEISSLNERAFEALLISFITFIPIFTIFGLHRAVFRYSGFFASLIVLKACFIYGLIYSMLITVYGFSGIPRTIGLIQPLLFFAFASIWRILVSYFLGGIYRKHWRSSREIKALIYGAGSAGRQLFKAIEDSKDIYIKGFLDDDKTYHGRFINGKLVYPPNQLKRQINEKGINLILLAIPSVSRPKRMKIIKKLRQYKVAVRTVPGISDIARGFDINNYLQDLSVDDLLERKKIEPFNHLMKKNINSKVVLVTGAGGSIGSELCRQILNLNPSKILMIEINEYSLYSIHAELNELQNKFKNKKNVELIPLLSSINDKKRMNRIISTWKPATIYHTAAYKHVPLVEHNLIEGLKNNIFGTLSMTELAIKNKVSDFVLISTDKAVRPTNIMGASKRISELILQAKFHRPSNKNTKFSIVRFGNVLESSGSVIPKFREQIRKGGPLTLTHKKITRYFMTINEAAELVIQAGAMAKGGEVFILDMGNPVKILTLAERMIELSGLEIKNELNPNGDIEIVTVGLRPGEKLYEELLVLNNPLPTKHPKIFKSIDPYLEWDLLKSKISNLEKCIKRNDYKDIRNCLGEIIHDYKPKDKIVDYLFLENKINN